MGLDYLQKKNWHPGSKRNREDVWVREQMQKEIMKKVLFVLRVLGTREGQEASGGEAQ
jgi:N-terminal domain of CBF1 interacting co-repressor CIR